MKNKSYFFLIVLSISTSHTVRAQSNEASIVETCEARVTKVDRIYTISKSQCNYSIPGAGFVFSSPKSLAEFCEKNGGEVLGRIDTNSLSFEHQVVYGTKYFFDLEKKQWVAVTDQPYDYYDQILCFKKKKPWVTTINDSK